MNFHLQQPYNQQRFISYKPIPTHSTTQDQMQKKVGDIVQAFQNYRFEDALRQIEQLTKKLAKDNKKKTALTTADQRLIQIIKCGSLASIGKIHQANWIINTYFTQKIISQLPHDQTFLFVSISELAYDQKLSQKVDILNKTNKPDIRLDRFMLSNRMFGQVSKSFLKEFALNKKSQDGLSQIFLSYLAEYNKCIPIETTYRKDMIYRTVGGINLKMVELFWMKYLSGIKIEELQNKKLQQSIIDLKLRIAINLGKVQQAKQIYIQHFSIIQQHFVYLRSIRDIQKGISKQINGVALPLLINNSNFKFYIDQCGKIFKRNVQIQNYTPLYDFYDEFLQSLLGAAQFIDQNRLKEVQIIINNEQIINQQQMYNFSNVKQQQTLVHYYKSLYSELKGLTEGQNKDKWAKSDYYKISVKGLILQLLKIHYQINLRLTGPKQIMVSLSNNVTFTSLLDKYFYYFSKTLTYLNELENYSIFIQEKMNGLFQECIGNKQNDNNLYSLPSVHSRQDDNLILLINIVKSMIISKKSQFQKWSQCEYWMEICWKSYKQFLKQVQQQKRRQKGQVFLSDEFITMFTDILLYHLQNNHLQKNQTSFTHNILFKLMAVLEQATEISPFNGYLKLRLLYVCQKLGYFDKLMDTYVSLDIKSVQFQTLGYFMVNSLINFNSSSQFQHIITKMVRSYHQNQRQTSQYCLKGLKAGTIHQVFEYFSYQKRLQKSYSKLIMFYLLFLNSKNEEHSQFYLEWIQTKLNQYKKNGYKVVWNSDTKTMQNSLAESSGSQSEYASWGNEYYGWLNSLKVFELEIATRKLQTLLNRLILSPNTELLNNAQTKLTELINCHTQIQKNGKFNELYNIQSQFQLLDQYIGNQQENITQNANNKHTLSFSQSLVEKQFQLHIKLIHAKIQLFKLVIENISMLKLTEKSEQLEKKSSEKFNHLTLAIEQVLHLYQKSSSWMLQSRTCWSLRETLFKSCQLLIQLAEESNKLKKLPKSIKTLINSQSDQLQKITLQRTTKIQFSEINVKNENELMLKIDVDKRYVEKVSERQSALRRILTMQQKQVKKYLAVK